LVNGLCTGAFDLQDPHAAADMTDKLLSMLAQYLVSNQSLQLDKSFQIYLKILSLGHTKLKGLSTKKKKQRNKFGKKHVGGKNSKPSMYYWAIEPKISNLSVQYQSSFLNKCLLICTIFGLLQHLFYESKRKNKLFLYASNINSKFDRKKSQACKIIQSELDKLFSVTKLQTIGPYHIQSTMKILSISYKCQFFVFTSNTGKHKLSYLYPSVYDDSLKPIYLYMPKSNQDLSEDHFIFIRNLNSYFRNNYISCFVCKKSFSSLSYKHMCSLRPTCFACRRFFQNESSYINEKLEKLFCDKLTTSEQAFLCDICQCTVYSQHCYKGHKLVCNGQGHFGYKCLVCGKFTYASKTMTSQYLKTHHVCDNFVKCKYCYKIKENDHLCKLSRTKLQTSHNRLAFFHLEFDQLDDFAIEPILMLSYLEQGRRGTFKKYCISKTNYNSSCTDDQFEFVYFPPNVPNTEFENLKVSCKITQDFIAKNAKLSLAQNFKSKLTYFFLSSSNTTFVCQDFDGKVMVNHSKVFMR